MGPSLRNLPYDRNELTQIIAGTMPPQDPEQCVGECASAIARLLLSDAFQEATDDDDICTSSVFAPRRLRLLSRREYAATVRAVLGGCDGHVFRYNPGERRLSSVHIAGTFNDWAPTIAQGGWALEKNDQGVWMSRRPLPPGVHRYKFVLNESEWLIDPANPNTEDDGRGNINSVIELRCADPSAALPPDARPDGFPFDDHAESAQVTSARLDAYLSAAEDLAAQVDECRGDCARQRVRDAGLRAFRRPLTSMEVERYARIGSRDAIAAMLASPHFLYRTELGEPDGEQYQLTAIEVASALSYFLWGGPPDEQLMEAAGSGGLDDEAGIAAASRRLLADPRARETLGSFALMWLGVEELKDAVRGPQLNAELRDAMLSETRSLFTSVVLDRSHRLEELFVSNQTQVTPELAEHYALEAGDASTYRYGRRAGLLGHGSVLATYAHSDQSSPIRRGLFVRHVLLCQPLPPPPPNAGGVPDVDPDATTRERFQQHSDDPFCSSCHTFIDPIGFGFERFDNVGRWRTEENGFPIPTDGDVTDVEGLGTETTSPFETLPQLGEILANSDAARRCFVTQVFRFAHGRFETPADRCAIDDLEAVLDSTGDLRELLVAVTTHPSFRRRSQESP